MKHIRSYEDFLNENYINEANTRPGDEALVNKFISAMSNTFGQLSYDWHTGKDEKFYDYGNSHIHVSQNFRVKTWKCINPKLANVLSNCGFGMPNVKMKYQYTEVISKGKFLPAYAEIWIPGKNYRNYSVDISIDNPKKVNFKKLANDFIKKAHKNTAKSIEPDLLEVLFSDWKPSSKDYKYIGSRDQGIGRHASVHITKSYEKAYVIKDLDIVFKKNKKATETYIKSHYMFKKNDLKFDWDLGFMIVNGEYTETWD